MKVVIKELAKRIISASVGVSRKTMVGRYLHNQVVNRAMGQTLAIFHGSLDMILPVPMSIFCFRAETFSTKDPETLEWIDGISKGSTLWDVGASRG